MKVVLDTNVLVSGLINPDGFPSKVINLLLNGKIVILYDNRIIEEYSNVLRRKKFMFKNEWIEPLLDYIKNTGEYVAADPITNKFQDEEDKKFYEVAISGKAKYIITGNRAHFPNSKIIKNPKEFIELYLSSSMP